MINTIINSFDIWTSAQGVKAKNRVKSIDNISLEGIAQLRGLIIDLAIQGKLTQQVIAEKQIIEVITETQNGKSEILPIVHLSHNEIPFVLPSGWCWTTLNSISQINGGFAFKSINYSNSGYRIIRISDFDQFGFKNDNIVRHVYSTELSSFLLNPKNIIIAMTGGTVGKSYLVKSLDEPMIVNQRVATIKISRPLVEEYIGYVILSSLVQKKIEEAKNSTNDNISMAEIKGFKIPLPPVTEQKRIVTKVDELMALCDQLEAQQTNMLKTHQQLVSSLLETLTQAKDADAVQAAWQQLLPHFDTLFCTEDSIEQLKQTILQLAIMGRLVKQDPKDEPASELIKKIEKEKDKLVKEGKIKKEKPLLKISEEEKTFELPKGWEWSRLNNVIDVRDGTHDSPKDAEGEDTFPLVTSKDFINGKINFESSRRISQKDHQEISKRSNVEKFDILFSMIGGNLGNQVLVTDDREFSIKNVALFKYYNKNYTSPFFIKKFTEYLGYSLQNNAKGGAQPFVALGYLRRLIIGLPPLAEQKRIVTKADELMSLCDQLKAKIIKSQEIQNTLSKTIVENAVA